MVSIRPTGPTIRRSEFDSRPFFVPQYHFQIYFTFRGFFCSPAILCFGHIYGLLLEFNWHRAVKWILFLPSKEQGNRLVQLIVREPRYCKCLNRQHLSIREILTEKKNKIMPEFAQDVTNFFLTREQVALVFFFIKVIDRTK